MRQAAEHSPDAAAAASARRLADVLDRLKAATPEVRAAAAAAVVTPLKIMLDQVRAELKARPITIESLPRELIADWTAVDARARLLVLPKDDHDNASLRRFAQAVQSVAPDATGWPISTAASGESIVHAFLQAGAYSFVAITVLLAAVLRRVRDVVLTMLPVMLSGLLTFGTCAALDLPLNFTNIIALPLLFGVGVAFNIYFVLAWRAGETAMLQSSLMRAVVFSAMTTATAFGALWLSSHPGTASMGRLLMISLAWELLVTVLFRPALLAQPPARTISATDLDSGRVIETVAARRLPLGTGFQLVDQRFDLAAVIADVGNEIRPPGHGHADALGLDVDDARALAFIAHLPLDGDRIAVALVELAVDDGHAVSPGIDAAHRQRLAAVLTETLRIGACLRAGRGLEEARALLGSGLVPIVAERRAAHA